MRPFVFILVLALLLSITLLPTHAHQLYIRAAPTGNSLRLTNVDGALICQEEDPEVCGSKSRINVQFDPIYQSKLDSYTLSFYNPLKIDQEPWFLEGAFGPNAHFTADVNFPERLTVGMTMYFHIRVVWKEVPDVTESTTTAKQVTITFGTASTVSATSILNIVKRGASSESSIIRRVKPTTMQSETTTWNDEIAEEENDSDSHTLLDLHDYDDDYDILSVQPAPSSKSKPLIRFEDQPIKPSQPSSTPLHFDEKLAKFAEPQPDVNYFQTRLGSISTSTKRFLLTPYGSMRVFSDNFSKIRCWINSEPMKLTLIRQYGAHDPNPFLSILATLPRFYSANPNLYFSSNADLSIECFDLPVFNKNALYGIVFQFISEGLAPKDEFSLFDQPQYTIERWSNNQMDLSKVIFDQYLRPKVVQNVQSGYILTSGTSKIYHSQYRFAVQVLGSKMVLSNDHYFSFEVQNTENLELMGSNLQYFFGLDSSNQPRTEMPRVSSGGWVKEDKDGQHDTTKNKITYFAKLTPSFYDKDAAANAADYAPALLIVELEFWHKLPPDASAPFWAAPTFVVSYTQPFLTPPQSGDATFTSHAVSALSRFSQPTGTLRDLDFSGRKRSSGSSTSKLDAYDFTFSIKNLRQNLVAVLFDVAVREFDFQRAQTDSPDCVITPDDSKMPSTRVIAKADAYTGLAHPDSNRSIYLQYDFLKGKGYTIECPSIFLKPIFATKPWPWKAQGQNVDQIPIHMFGYTDKEATTGVFGFSNLKLAVKLNPLAIVIGVILSLVVLAASCFAVYHFVYLRVYRKKQEQQRLESMQAGLVTQTDDIRIDSESPFGDNHYRQLN